MYASKRRQRNFKRVRDPPKSLVNTNPSKRHRERLNGELETVAMLLPYDSATISRLDKLSVLRLAVSFLQCKAHFQACLHNANYLNIGYPMPTHSYIYHPQLPTPFSNKVPTIFDPRIGQPMLDHEESNFEDISLRALGGFILVLNDNGEIYYASENVESFLGFHQSDVLHQPIYDLIHSEDRDDIRQQLDTNFHIPPTTSSSHIDVFAPQNVKYLDRNVNARFRCLLDNTCGFLRIDMRGKLFSLHGLPSSYVMGRTNNGPVLGMICVCTPFVPPSTSEMVSEDMILKTKHQLDGSLVSMDHKVYEMLEFTESDLPMSLYSIIHVEDAVCMAEAHKEVIKNGSSGLLVYRMVSNKTRRVYFVQSSCRLFYKNSKPESIGLTHRVLNEVEGTMLLEKRSSLKAKLLSFDDSFLQSPRNLQSTAALPLPAAAKDDEEQQQQSSSMETPLPPSTSSAYPTSSSSLPIVPHQLPVATVQPMRSRKRKEEPKNVPLPVVLPPQPQHFEIPLFDLQYHSNSIHHWGAQVGDIYTQHHSSIPHYSHHGPYPPILHSHPHSSLTQPNYNEIHPQMDYGWHGELPPMSMPHHLIPVNSDAKPFNHQSTSFATIPDESAYPIIPIPIQNSKSHHQDGFNLIS